MESLIHDLRAAARTVTRRPGFALTMTLTLAAGIGLCTSVFSILYAVLIRPLPYTDPARLVLVAHQTVGSDEYGAMSSPDMLDYRTESRVLSDVAAVNSFSASLAGDDTDAEQIQLGVVTANFFTVLGVRPRVGRDFVAADDTPMDTRDPRNASVVLLGHALWERRYGGDPGVIGRTVRVGGTPMTVIGVLPREFRLHMPRGVSMTTELDAWTPLRVPYASAPREGAYLKVVARLRPGATVAQAQADVAGIAERLRARFAFHDAARLRARVIPLHDAAVAHVESLLAGLSVAVGFVLLIACANAANLLLVRLAARDREILVRTALGASRSRLVRQLLAESGALAVVSAVGGIGLAWAGIRLVHWLRPATLPHVETIAIEPAVLVFAVGLSLASVLAFGLAPALLASRRDLAAGLRERTTTGGVTWRRLRAGLVVGEVAVSVVLLVGAGLMIRTVRTLQRMDLGFEPAGAATFRVSLPFTRYRRPEDWRRFATEVEERLGAVAGVRAVGGASTLPASGVATLEPFALDAAEEDRAWGTRSAAYVTVTPGYFATLSIPVRAGRAFGEQDTGGGPRVIVVDEALASRLWPNESAVGRRLRVSVALFDRGYRVERVPAEVVGVVGTVAHGRPDERPPGAIYLPHAQQPLWNMAFSVASEGRPGDIAVAARAVLRELDAELPLYDARPMRDVVEGTMAETRMVLSALSLFATAAALLAGVGLYAVVAYLVRQRRKELSIRLALGATPWAVGTRVLRDGFLLVTGGVAIGAAASLAIADVLSGVVVGVPPRDLATLLAVSVLLLVVGLGATVLPAYRAASIDPVAGLREE